MRRIIQAAVALAALALSAASAPASAAVGFQHLTIPDPHGQPIEVGIWYPTDAKARPETIELAPQTVARDAPVRGGHLPLVVMSHGHGGSYVGHLDTAIALAEHGFVAAALTHPGDNWRDESKATQAWERPRQLKVLTDYMLAAWPSHARIDPRRVGAFGFSAGGFTVLVEAGADPDMGRIAAHCRAHPEFETCRIVAGQPQHLDRPISWTHDRRIRAVVAAAPAIGFTFTKENTANLRQPVQLWRAADDQVLPHPYYAEAVRLALPTPPETHVVAHAGHYDFIPPCSPALKQAVPMICASEPGFDRARFHARFNRDLVGFFARTLR